MNKCLSWARQLQVEENGLVTKWGLRQQRLGQSKLSRHSALSAGQRKAGLVGYWRRRSSTSTVETELEAMRLFAEAPVESGDGEEMQDGAQFGCAAGLAGKIALATQRYANAATATRQRYRRNVRDGFAAPKVGHGGHDAFLCRRRIRLRHRDDRADARAPRTASPSTSASASSCSCSTTSSR